MKKDTGPFPSPHFFKQIAANVIVPVQAFISGEISASPGQSPVGAALRSGRVVGAWMSLGASGKDDSSALQISGEVYINGVTCLSTRPSIAHVSGEASQQKTTKVPGDTGIAQAVIDATANTFSEGDVFSMDFTVVRTSSPTTEMSQCVVVVELEPIRG
jgi:hypothetical protein